MRVHTYVITVNAGSGPNYDPPCVTLAICKPRIRRTATKGELVLAFAGNSSNRHEPHTVVWAGVVQEKLTFGQYWSDKRFRPKRPDRSPHPDNFYCPENGTLVWVDNPVHGRDHAMQDTGGEFVLTFAPSWRFGAHGPILPTEFGLRLTGGRRGERLSDLTEQTWRRLKDWLEKSAMQSPLGPVSLNRCRPPRPTKKQSTHNC